MRLVWLWLAARINFFPLLFQELEKEATEYLTTGAKRIFLHGVETVLMALRGVARYKPFFSSMKIGVTFAYWQHLSVCVSLVQLGKASSC